MTDSNHEPEPYSLIEKQPFVRKADFVGLDLPTYENEDEEPVIYDVNATPQFHTTRALFVGNLRKPINAGQFQQYLKRFLEGRFTIERCWLNKPRTHAIVLINNEDGAEFLREKILGITYPTEEEDSILKEEFQNKEIERYENELKHYEELPEDEKEHILPPIEPREFEVERLPLYVEYIPVKAINQWTYEEDRGPKNGKWKLEFEFRNDDKSDPVASHTLLNGDFIPRFNPRMSYNGHRNNGHYRNRYDHGRHHRQYTPRDQPRVRSTDSYVPGGGRSRESTSSYVPRQTNSKTDSYVPGRSRGRRSRSPSRSPPRF